MRSATRHAARLGCAALALLGCGEHVQPTYSVTVVGPVGVDPFASAVKVTVQIDNGCDTGQSCREIAVTPGQPFDVSVQGITAGSGVRGAIRIEAFDAGGKLVAYGETPPVELETVSQTGIRIFVQPPGTLGRTDVALGPRHGHIAAPATEKLSGQSAVVFGLGDFLPAMAAAPETDDSVGAYDPLTHELDGGLGLAFTARRDASAIELGDERVLVFGGEVPGPAPGAPFQPSPQGAIFELVRNDFAAFGVINDAVLPGPSGSARADAPLAIADRVYAFGGRDAGGPLDSVVRIGPGDPPTSAVVLLGDKMSAPRLGHTATAVPGAEGTQVLLFGGAPAGAAVAELFQPAAAPPFTAFDNADAGANRRDHAALLLPGKSPTVLVIGGLGDGGAPLGDAVVYDPRQRAFAPRAAFLATPRAGMCAFVVDSDLVVAGGLGAGGAPVGDAEIFDAASLERVAVVPAAARAHARCAPLPNHAVVLLGGDGAGGALDGTIEIYQPRR